MGRASGTLKRMVALRFCLTFGFFWVLLQGSAQAHPEHHLTDSEVCQQWVQADWGLALAACERALQKTPEHAELWFRRGIAHYELSDVKAALIANQQALRFSPHHELALLNQPVYHEALDDVTAAIKAWEQYFEVFPHSDHRMNRVEFWERQGDLEQAIGDLNRILQMSPELGDAYYRRGVLYRKQGQRSLALADLNRALVLQPERVNAYGERALVHAEMESYEQALADLTEALRLDPKQVYAYYLKGSILNDLERHREAKHVLDQAIAVNDSVGLLYYERGRAKIGFQDDAGALSDFTLCLQWSTDLAPVYVERSLVYSRQGNNTLALEDIAKALQEQPTAFAYYLRAYYLSQRQASGDAQRAQADFKTALEQGLERPSDQLSAWYWRAWNLAILRDYSAAHAAINQALLLEPEDVETLALQAWIYYLAGDNVQAKNSWSTLLPELKNTQSAQDWVEKYKVFLLRDRQLTPAKQRELTQLLDVKTGTFTAILELLMGLPYRPLA